MTRAVDDSVRSTAMAGANTGADSNADVPDATVSATVSATLDALASRLAGAMAPPARAEARDLIAAVLDVPRFWPSAHGTRTIAPRDVDRINDAADRLQRGMPFAYAVRRAAFRSLSLYVDERVLIPRPETELLVDQVLAATGGGRGIAIDLGTGSGAIALALATEGRFERVIGTDVSADALAVAQKNGAAIVWDETKESPTSPASPIRHPASRVEFRQGAYFAPLRGVRADVMVSNPPYISWADADELPASVRDWEPAVALFADDNGMAAINVIVNGASDLLLPGGMLALEVDSRRAETAADLVRGAYGFRDVVVLPDLTGRARFVCARRA